MQWLKRLIYVSVLSVILGAGVGSAQDDTVCQPDFGPVYGFLAQAQVAFDNGDQTTGVAAVSEARRVLVEIEAACGSGVPLDTGVTIGAPGPIQTNLLPAIDRADLRAWLESDVYHVESTTGDRRYIELIGVEVGDFTLDVDVTVQPGFVAGAGYGIAFRGAPGFGQDFYHWRVSTNGAIIVLANWRGASRGAMQTYIPAANANDWLSTPAYQPGADVVNHLKLQCVGEQCTYLINGQQVMQTRDSRLSSGGIALVTEGVMHVIFENLQVTTAGGAPVSVEPVTGDHGEADILIEYTGLHPCGEWPAYAEFRIDNGSEMAFESVSVELVDATTEQTILGPSYNNQPFTLPGECPPGAETLEIADTACVKFNVSSSPPGTKIDALLELCTGQDRTGTCVAQTVQFVIE